jgi:outer membrane protein OmpA-like peptidoglycan-associated protein
MNFFSWLLLISILISGQIVQAVTCNQYVVQVDNALYAKDLPKLAELLRILKRLPDCSDDYLNLIKRNMSSLAADKANYLVRQGRLKEAETWLQYKYVQVNMWMTQTVRGNIAAKNQQWKNATRFYNQSLDLMADSKATPQSPSRAEIEKVFKLASETLLLAGTLTTTVRSSGQPSGVMRDSIRGIEIRKHPIPVQFVFGKTTVTKEAEDSVDILVKYLKFKKPDKIVLVGHTDHIGSEKYNCWLSIRRAKTLKSYLVNAGIRTNITTIGKGEYEPFELSELNHYTRKQINQINRRVEFAIDDSVLYSEKCK